MKFAHFVLTYFCWAVSSKRRKPRYLQDSNIEKDEPSVGENAISISDYLKDPATFLPTESNLLSSERITSRHVLQQHNKYHENLSRHYSGEIAAYVTPWNKKGYSFAKIFSKKLNWLIPVWFQIRYRIRDTYFN